MSIDARIAGITRNTETGEVTMTLEDRNSRSIAGQSRMTILDPPPMNCDLSRLVGREMWGNSSDMLIGDSKIADRVGYTAMRLVSNWTELV